MYIVYVMHINRSWGPHLEGAFCGYSFLECGTPLSHRTYIRENGVAPGGWHACRVDYLHGLFPGGFTCRLWLGPFRK